MIKSVIQIKDLRILENVQANLSKIHESLFGRLARRPKGIYRACSRALVRLYKEVRLWAPCKAPKGLS